MELLERISDPKRRPRQTCTIPPIINDYLDYKRGPYSSILSQEIQFLDACAFGKRVLFYGGGTPEWKGSVASIADHHSYTQCLPENMRAYVLDIKIFEVRAVRIMYNSGAVSGRVKNHRSLQTISPHFTGLPKELRRVVTKLYINLYVNDLVYMKNSCNR